MDEKTFQQFIEVSRVSHQLNCWHGWKARGYAAQLEAAARAIGNVEETEFWERVKASLTPRNVLVAA